MKVLARTMVLVGLLSAVASQELIAQPPPPVDPFLSPTPAPTSPPGVQLPQAAPPPVTMAAAPAPQNQPVQGPVRRLRKRIYNFFHPGAPI
jgi:hypothetical protein